MHFTPGCVYHLYNRGNNKQTIFFISENYQFFLQKIKTQLSPVCEILCWCLMPNHFHLMIYATESSCVERNSFGGNPMQELAYRIGIMLSSYSQAINKQNHTIGSLFQQKTKAKCIGCPEDQSGNRKQYIVTCMKYIHQNPKKANLVQKLEDWDYSSFRGYVGMDIKLPCNQKLMEKLTGFSERDFYVESNGCIKDEDIERIW